MALKKIKLIMVMVFLFFLISTTIVVADKLIKEDWFEHDETFAIGTDVYNVFVNPSNYDLLRFKQNAFTTTIMLEQCKTHESYTFCYRNNSFDKKVTIDSQGRLMPGVHVKITQSEEAVADYNLALTSTFTGKKFLNYGDEAKITIKNTGSSSLFGAELILEIPENVTITNRKQFTQFLKTLKRTLSVGSDDEVEYSFNYMMIGEGSQKINYDIVKDGKSLKTGSFTATGALPYKITMNTPATTDIQEIATFELIIKNEHLSDEINLKNLIIRGPLNFQYLSAQSLHTNIFGRYTATPTMIIPNSERKYTIRYRPIFAGEYTFLVEGNIERNREYELEEKKELKVVNQGLNPSMTFTRKDITLGTDTELVFAIKNDHPSRIFKNIEVQIQSPLFNGTKQHAEIGPGETVNLFNQKINPPQEPENKDYDFNATINFQNEAGQAENKVLKERLRVSGKGPILKITQKVNPIRVEAGDEVVVEVVVMNLKDNTLRNIQFIDTLTQKPILITGKQEITTELYSKQEKQAYLYKITVPEKPTNRQLEIKTTARIPEINYEQTATTKITVDGPLYEAEPEPEPEVEEEVEEETTNTTDSNGATGTTDDTTDESGTPANEGDGYLKRMIKGIEGFFSNLFGKK